MTKGLAKKLSLTAQGCHVPIGALNSLTTVAKSMVTATIQSTRSSYKRTLTFLTIPTIAQQVPDQHIDREQMAIPRNLQLADPTFHQPAPVDLLLGAGTALSLLCVGQINLSPCKGIDLYLQKTRLGWVIGGSTPSIHSSSRRSCHNLSVQFDMAKFWEVEEGPSTRPLSKEETACETHFRQTITRNAEGRYQVTLPFNGHQGTLGESHSRALKRFHALERKFVREPELKQQYQEVMQEYLDLGHMSPVPPSQLTLDGYYLPHHGVFKEGSLTTKLRVVFDASAKTSTGVSLNDTLYTGPPTQDDLLNLLLRFRLHRYVLTGDVEKMYRQFLVRPEDRKYQRILWRDEKQEISTFHLNTVTFGLSAAPYLATRCLVQLADDNGHQHPAAARAIRRDFYVDDVLTGAHTKKETMELRQGLIHLLQQGGLNIRQWASNDPSLLKGLSETSLNKQLQLGESSCLKTLGIMWDSAEDSISYKVRTATLSHISKRVILSEIAKIYDPLGLLGPVIILAKIFIQRLWAAKVDWDESLPEGLHTEWLNFYHQLPSLNNVSFPRRTIISHEDLDLHGFCDASERAYGACVYLRSQDRTGRVYSELLIAKSRVAPLKPVTIPRLELCAATLLANLCTTVLSALHLKVKSVHLWTDSTIVLHWLHTQASTLKTFVANRVAEIQSKTSVEDWNHVRTADNPADLLSRGQTPETFLQQSIWQHGPTWLTQDPEDWPTWVPSPTLSVPEQRTTVCVTAITQENSILSRYSSLGKLLRVVAYCLRWKLGNQAHGPLTASDLRQALHRVIKLTQETAFAEERQCLLSNRSLPKRSKLLRLTPFLDPEGLLRVGGRLKNATIPFTERHPLILPKSAPVTALIIKQEHLTHLHAGVQTTLYAVRRRYWPVDGRSQVWKMMRSCVTCCRAKPPPTNYVMGNLPRARVTESRPFSNVGVDYCGPFFIKEKKHRNRGKVKAYVAVFVCMAVKAVHLELVSDLTSEGFIAALRRFISRRGFCKNLYSDNGTNFVGANRELQELRELFHSQTCKDDVQHFLADHSVNWHFIPPQAPHFGGLWEAAVKSFKSHFKRVAGSTLFTFEDFNTLIVEIEAILNSRPLTCISSDAADPLVLTPGHFLIGESLTAVQDPNVTTIPSNRLSMWQHVQKVKQDFWARWHREYLNELTTRTKWSAGHHPIKEGAIVLLREDNLPPTQWALGRVIRVCPGTDGIIRVATVRTATNTLDRSVRKLVPLPVEAPPATTEHQLHTIN